MKDKELRKIMHSKEDNWKEFYRTKYPGIWKKRVKHYGFTEYHREILRLLNAQEGEKILECGIGIGWPLAISLGRKGINITGVDISSELLEQCQTNFHKENLTIDCYKIDMDRTNLPFKDGSFDKVYFISTSWYLLNIKNALSEMVRVTKQKGLVIFDILNFFHISSLSIFTYNIIRNSKIVQKIKPSHSLHKYRSPFLVNKILKRLNVDYTIKGYYILLPVCFPLVGDRADICKYSHLFSYGLADSLIKYLGSKLVYICRKR